MDQYVTWHEGIDWALVTLCEMGTQLSPKRGPLHPSQRGSDTPQFSVNSLGPGHIVLNGDPSSPEVVTASSQFSSHVYCGKTAGWIKLPLGTLIGLRPGQIVLDGDPAPTPPFPLPPKRGTQRPMLGRSLLWPNGSVNQDAGGYGGRPRPRPQCVRPSLPESGTAPRPQFSALSVVAKRLDVSGYHSIRR